MRYIYHCHFISLFLALITSCEVTGQTFQGESVEIYVENFLAATPMHCWTIVNWVVLSSNFMNHSTLLVRNLIIFLSVKLPFIYSIVNSSFVVYPLVVILIYSGNFLATCWRPIVVTSFFTHTHCWQHRFDTTHFFYDETLDLALFASNATSARFQYFKSLLFK